MQDKVYSKAILFLGLGKKLMEWDMVNLTMIPEAVKHYSEDIGKLLGSRIGGKDVKEYFPSTLDFP